VTILDAVILGIIQGITEFLPISSTAHLTLAGKLLGLITPDNAAAWTSFIAVIQLGTLAAVIVYFLKDLGAMTAALWTDLRTHGGGKGLGGYRKESRLALLVVVGTIPVGLAGILLSDFLHSMLTKSTVVIIGSLVALALLLWIAEHVARHVRGIDNLRLGDALVIGCAQALALIPGSSRSGTTITAGLFLGCRRPAAAQFSFLLSIPAILASGAHEVLQIHWHTFTYGAMPLVVGTVFAGVSGYAAIAWLLRFLSTHTTMTFVFYRITLGIVLALLLLSGHIEP
jgi:undecaprenyl-diphosphatase